MAAPFTLIWHDADIARQALAAVVRDAEKGLTYFEEIVQLLESHGVTVLCGGAADLPDSQGLELLVRGIPSIRSRRGPGFLFGFHLLDAAPPLPLARVVYDHAEPGQFLPQFRDALLPFPFQGRGPRFEERVSVSSKAFRELLDRRQVRALVLALQS
ncbi:hypothetical protein OG978_18960 [Streptomyces sp. NBC_01591]|nr:hypothetical protein [Streptomyces sp. NBC_01591]WSD69295.1 hypothetical protein OG978_18960 [Streptomyces sp. NBC_01591]